MVVVVTGGIGVVVIGSISNPTDVGGWNVVMITGGIVIVGGRMIAGGFVSVGGGVGKQEHGSAVVVIGPDVVVVVEVDDDVDSSSSKGIGIRVAIIY